MIKHRGPGDLGHCEWHGQPFASEPQAEGPPIHFAGQNACDGEVIRTREGEVLYRREDIRTQSGQILTQREGIQEEPTRLAEWGHEHAMPATEPLDIPQGVAVCQNCDAKPALENSAYCSACEFEMFGDQQPDPVAPPAKAKGRNTD